MIADKMIKIFIFIKINLVIKIRKKNEFGFSKKVYLYRGLAILCDSILFNK